MAEKENKNVWSTRVGTIKEGSLEDFKTENGKEGQRAVIVNKEGKENFIVAFTDAQKTRLKEAVEAGVAQVVRGPAFFNKDRESFVMVNTVKEYNPEAPKPELTEEEKAAKAAERKAAVAERDKTRVPVVEGSVAEGDAVTVNGEEVSVTALGTAWELDTEEKVEALAARFPDVEGIALGAKVQFASFEAPEPEAETAGPGM
jgi:hypothetical protein